METVLLKKEIRRRKFAFSQYIGRHYRLQTITWVLLLRVIQPCKVLNIFLHLPDCFKGCTI